MITLKNILVATDFSEASDAAVAFARQLASAFGSTLHLVHVAGDILAGGMGLEVYTTDYTSLQRDVEDAAKNQLDAMATQADRDALKVKTVVLTSNAPALTIVSYAKEHAVDLVVVGTHGRGGMAHLFLGSVAERVVRTAPCPVLTVGHSLHGRTVQEPTEVVAHA
jgi:nucleotide-binding universal stress UspA family protein